MPLGEGADEGMTARGKAPHFDVEERPRHQGALGPPSLDHGTLAVKPVVVPDRHDRKTRRDQENRWVKRDAQPSAPFRQKRRKGPYTGWLGTGAPFSLAPNHFKPAEPRPTLHTHDI